MKPDIGSVYVCVNSNTNNTRLGPQGIRVGELFLINRVIEMYDVDTYDDEYRYAIFINNIDSKSESIFYIKEFLRCFVSIEDWRESRLKGLEL
jgi:hypothetical protein